MSLLVLNRVMSPHFLSCCCCSVTKSCPPLRPHGLQHTRFPCLSLSPGVCSNSRPLSWWCYLTIWPSVIPFSSCLQSFPASGSDEFALHIRWPKYWSFSFSISPFKEYSGLISLRISFRILSYILLITPLQYSCLEIPWTEEPGGLQSMGPLRVGQDWATSLTIECLRGTKRLSWILYLLWIIMRFLLLSSFTVNKVQKQKNK